MHGERLVAGFRFPDPLRRGVVVGRCDSCLLSSASVREICQEGVTLGGTVRALGGTHEKQKGKRGNGERGGRKASEI